MKCRAEVYLSTPRVLCVLFPRPDSSVSASTTPAVSCATAAAPASTRSRGAPPPSTARTNVSVSVGAQWLLDCAHEPTERLAL